MRVVVIGSGLAGVTLAEGLKAHDVSLVTAETVGYYPRPRLSHGVSIGEVDLVMRRFENLPFRVLAGAEAWLIERDKRRLVVAESTALDYDALVLASGSASRVPPVLAPSRAHFLTLNSYQDLLQLRRRRAQILAHGRPPRWAVIGGGLIGCELASDLRKAGDSCGARIRVTAGNVPVGLGEPLFDRLDADIAYAMMGINAVKGVEIGAGFASVAQRDTTHGDSPTPRGFRTNNAGGVLGGISSGQDLEVSIAIKPTSSIVSPRDTVNTKGEATQIVTKGRHDPCVGIRATPVAEAMIACVLADHLLRQRAQCG